MEGNRQYFVRPNRFAGQHRKKVFCHSMETTHDLGFLYQPYSIAMYQLTGDNGHKNTALKAADELLKRFQIEGRYLDAWRKGCFTSDLPMYQHMADSFHFFFTYEHAKEPFPYPDKLIDSCLAMYLGHEMSPDFGKRFHFAEIDWVFCLNRASRQTPHRFYEVKETLFRFAKEYTDYLLALNWETDDGANDLHMLFGTLCCLCGLQFSLHGRLYSDVPLRQVLDRRPFI